MFSHYSFENNIIENRPILQHLNKLRVNINSIHLWLEESIIGDKNINIKNDIYKKIEEEIILLSKYENINDLATRSDILKIKKQLLRFYKNSQKRINNKTIAGSNDDQEYDNNFLTLNETIDNTIFNIHNNLTKEFQLNNTYFLYLYNFFYMYKPNYFPKYLFLNQKRYKK